MHAANLCHRDIKLDNVVLDESLVCAKICDMGMVTQFGGDSFNTTYTGTPAYMAPEIQQEVRQVYNGNQVDIFAMGVMIYLIVHV